MNKSLQVLAAMVLAITAQAQVTQGTVAMGAGYSNQVFYKLSNAETNIYPHASWDLAFLRTSDYEFATRVNDAKGISIFEAGTVAAWDAIDVSQEADWTQLYNSETEWGVGAADSGSATYGWGEYNFITHHVSGSIAFILKYADSSYKKFRIDDFFGGYTITYSSWNGTAWGENQTTTISNATNPTTLFNYFSLQDNAAVVAEPASSNWDLVFTKYNTDYVGDGSIMYPVVGALHHPDVEVAENLEVGGTGDNSGLVYSPNINTVGYHWKTFSGTAYTINSDKAFYLKYAAGTIYRLVFESFAGSSTGVITFNYEDVTSQLGLTDVNANASFGVYPNPTVGKKINVVYDIASGSAENQVEIYNLSGSKVFAKTLSTSTGFFNSEIDLNNLQSGIYLLKFKSGEFNAIKKIVIN